MRSLILETMKMNMVIIEKLQKYPHKYFIYCFSYALLERLISESSSHSNLSGFLSGNVNMSNRHNKFSAEADNQSGVPTQSDLRLVSLQRSQNQFEFLIDI